MWYGSEEEERTKNTSEIKFQFPWRSSVSLNLAGFYWKNVCLEYWPLWHSHYTLGVATGAKNVMEWILQPIFMKIPILETHWHQEEPWQMSLTYIEVLWICPLDRRLFKLQFVNSVCKICQNLNRKCGNNSISCLKHWFLKNNMWKNKQNTTTWYKCRIFCWDFDTFCRLN